MNKKKLMWIGLLALVIVLIVCFIVFVKPKEKSQIKQETGNTIAKNEVKTSSINEENTASEEINEENYEFKKMTLSDGTLYTRTGNEEKADVVIGNNYFDTQINDMMINYNQFLGKKIEVEGFYLSSDPYTFVGRYSTSNLCAYCPTGYSYLEYELHGSIDEKFTEEGTWLKVIGEFKEGKDNMGTDAVPQYSTYYYLDVITIEVMNEKGQETVNN